MQRSTSGKTATISTVYAVVLGSEKKSRSIWPDHHSRSSSETPKKRDPSTLSRMLELELELELEFEDISPWASALCFSCPRDDDALTLPTIKSLVEAWKAIGKRVALIRFHQMCLVRSHLEAQKAASPDARSSDLPSKWSSLAETFVSKLIVLFPDLAPPIPGDVASLAFHRRILDFLVEKLQRSEFRTTLEALHYGVENMWKMCGKFVEEFSCAEDREEDEAFLKRLTTWRENTKGTVSIMRETYDANADRKFKAESLQELGTFFDSTCAEIRQFHNSPRKEPRGSGKGWTQRTIKRLEHYLGKIDEKVKTMTTTERTRTKKKVKSLREEAKKLRVRAKKVFPNERLAAMATIPIAATEKVSKELDEFLEKSLETLWSDEFEFVSLAKEIERVKEKYNTDVWLETLCQEGKRLLWEAEQRANYCGDQALETGAPQGTEELPISADTTQAGAPGSQPIAQEETTGGEQNELVFDEFGLDAAENMAIENNDNGYAKLKEESIDDSTQIAPLFNDKSPLLYGYEEAEVLEDAEVLHFPAVDDDLRDGKANFRRQRVDDERKHGAGDCSSQDGDDDVGDIMNEVVVQEGGDAEFGINEVAVEREGENGRRLVFEDGFEIGTTINDRQEIFVVKVNGRPRRCDGCAKWEGYVEFLACGICHRVSKDSRRFGLTSKISYYCGKECQLADWEIRHRVFHQQRKDESRRICANELCAKTEPTFKTFRASVHCHDLCKEAKAKNLGSHVKKRYYCGRVCAATDWEAYHRRFHEALNVTTSVKTILN